MNAMLEPRMVAANTQGFARSAQPGVAAAARITPSSHGVRPKLIIGMDRRHPARPIAGIAEREAVGERHIRLLAPLAFLSPLIIAAIADGTAPADLTVTGLAKALPYSWAEQDRAILRTA